MTLSGLLFWSIVPGTASAVPSAGILVRLEAEGQLFTEAPIVELTPTTGGEAKRVVLADNGSAPDVVADDGQWAGVIMQDGRSFRVRAILNGAARDGGTVSWDEGAGSRELVLSDGWTGLQAHAGVAMGGTGSTTAPKKKGRRDAKVEKASPARTESAPSLQATRVGSWTDWLPLAGGLLSLLLGFGLAIRNSRPPIRPMRLPRLPEPPILGPGTPALHQGLSLWQVSAADKEVVGTALLRTMARSHRVLLVQPDDRPAVTALGGPVYRTTDAAAADVEDHLIDLFERPGLPVAVLFVLDAVRADEIAAFRDLLDPAVGGIVLYSSSAAEHTADIEVHRVEHEVTLRSTSHTVAARITESGLQVTAP